MTSLIGSFYAEAPQVGDDLIFASSRPATSRATIPTWEKLADNLHDVYWLEVIWQINKMLKIPAFFYDHVTSGRY